SNPTMYAVDPFSNDTAEYFEPDRSAIAGANSSRAKSRIYGCHDPHPQRLDHLRRRKRRPRHRLDRSNVSDLRSSIRRVQEERLHQSIRTADQLTQVPPLRSRRRRAPRTRYPQRAWTLQGARTAREEGAVS